MVKRSHQAFGRLIFGESIQAVKHFYMAFDQAVADKYQQQESPDPFPLRMGKLVSAVRAFNRPFR